VIDPRVEQQRDQRGWTALRGQMAVGATGRRDTRWLLGRALWLALLPIYLVMAVLVTVAYAVAVLIVDVRSWLRRGTDSH
jgi:hypothetical protein